MTKLGRELVEIKAYGYKIHAEMATFTDKSLFKDLLLNVFLNADSIGLNEQVQRSWKEGRRDSR